jgi:protein involved in polysaccharide export with SLBB domain
MRSHACGFTGHQEDPGLLDLLDRVAPRQPPAGDVVAKAWVVVTGRVRNPGLVPWAPGMTVAEAIERAGGESGSPHAGYTDLKISSNVSRRRAGSPRAVYPASLTLTFMPDDELFVAGDLRRQNP